MKNYTDIEQSKKLAEILPLESADMWWPYYYDVVSDTGEYDKEPMLHKPISDTEHTIPCWSLAALLELIPYLTIVREGNGWYGETEEGRIVSYASNTIDACVEMIYKLKERNLL